jgi:MFS family permease
LEDDHVLQRLGFPDVGPHRRFVSALAIDALGSGVWMPLSMLYFLHETSLSLVQLGLVMTIANLAVMPTVPLIGALVDRFGAKVMLQLGNGGAAVAFLLYPFAHSPWQVASVVFTAQLTRSGFWSALGPMVTQITEPGERELWFGFLQAMRNAGYGVGGVFASVALTIGTAAAYQSVVLANAASYVLAFLLMARVSGGGRVLGEEADRSADSGSWWVALADRGYRWLIATTFCYALAEMTLNVAMPVYFVRSLGLPGWMPGTVFVINTVMIGVGQGLIVRQLTGRVRRRVLHTAIVFSAVSFVLMYAAGLLSVRIGVVVVLAAAVVYTLGEMTAGPVVGALSAEAAPERMRGRYLAANQLAWSGSAAVAPLLFSWLLDAGSLAVWGGSLVLCLVWAVVVQVMSGRIPRANLPVTNVAEPEQLRLEPEAAAPLPD